MLRFVVMLLFYFLVSCAAKPAKTEIQKEMNMSERKRPHLFLSNMRECMALYHDDTICENKVMRSCHEDLDLHDCGKILLQVKDHDVLINKLR